MRRVRMTKDELKELGCLSLDVRDEMTHMDYMNGDGYAIETWPYERGKVYSVEFVVYPMYNWTKGNESGVSWELKNSVSSPNPVDSLDDAEWFIMGSVKWDSCTHYKYNQDSCMLHRDGMGGFETELRIWRKVYEAAREWMPETADF